MSVLKQQELDAFVAFAHGLADKSAQAVLRHFRALDRVEDKTGKGNFDPVTIADRAAEEVIRAEVAAHWPDHDVYGEEFGGKGSDADYCWLVDPIDGTRPYIMGWPIWGTLIGLLHKGDPVLGLMNQPFTGERFWNEGGRARYRGPTGETRLATRQCPRLEDAILTTSSPDLFATEDDEARFEALSSQVRMRWFGGDCYAYCMVAAGHVDLVVESDLSAYDIAPLIPIIEAAGGRVTSWDGGKAAQGGQAVACGDPALHEQVVKILSG